MIKIGTINKLTIKRIRNYGAQLDGGESGEVLLPKREVPVKAQPDDEIAVFVFPDREKNLRATTKKPLATVGQFARMQVVATSPAGAYMDWGMVRELLVPLREQQARMVEGKSYIIFVFLDEQGKRITGSTKLDKFLDQGPHDYLEGDEVDLIVCDRTDLGYKAIVDNRYWGMIYKNEVFQDLQFGQQLQGYIKKLRDDAKIDLRLQQSGYQGVDEVADGILETIRNQGGEIGLTDKSPPEAIYAMFGVSKKVFKKAIGSLYKKRLLSIEPEGIKLID